MAAMQRPLFVSAPGPASLKEIEKTLWEAADELRANSKLKSSEYSVPVLGLIFLRFADHKFAQAQQQLAATAQATGRRRGIGKADYQARGVMYLPAEACFERLLRLPEGENIGKAINDAMKAIEAENDELRDVLPKSYNRLENDTLVALLKTFSRIPVGIEGDAFGKIYEYFLGKFAMAEGQKGGEFFTPTSLVKLIVEVIEPYHGRIFDPACGSGGMFLQSARLVENRQGNTYCENLHNSVGRFDFVMANPPFNVDKVDKEKIKDDPRYPFGVPRADNANYLWIQEFWSALDDHGRAGFVMANSAADARGTELEIRRKLIEARAVDVMISIGPNFFYTVTLPCTLWFLDKGKRSTPRKDQVLFVDARQIFKQMTELTASSRPSRSSTSPTS